MEMRFPGLPMQAAILTFGVFFAMLMAYKARIIRVTESFVRHDCGDGRYFSRLPFELDSGNVFYRNSPHPRQWSCGNYL